MKVRDVFSDLGLDVLDVYDIDALKGLSKFIPESFIEKDQGDIYLTVPKSSKQVIATKSNPGLFDLWLKREKPKFYISESVELVEFEKPIKFNVSAKEAIDFLMIA